MKAARLVLCRAPGKKVEEVIQDAEVMFPELDAKAPEAKTFSARRSLLLSSFVIALDGSLKKHGIEEDRATNLSADIVFEVVRKFHGPVESVMRIFWHDPISRARAKSGLSQRLFYCPPDYVTHEVPLENGYGLDVERCIVAEYFRSLELGELCDRVMCGQDYRLAGGKYLRRTKTIARGADRCDFRYNLIPE